MKDVILQGDCLERLKELPNESVDLIVTDPPYGYSFMGKDWDKAVPSVEVWKECLRVLKSGAFAFVMSAPRQDVLSQMIVRITEAGFDTDFTSIYWTYASGFPKAMNIGKMVDKRNGRTSGLYANFARHYGEQRQTKGLTHNAVVESVKAYKTVNHGGASVNWEKGYNVPTVAQWQILRPLLGLSLDYLPLIEREEAERRVLGRHPTIKGHGSVFNKEFEGDLPMITAPATAEAKALDGSYGGFQPKPAVEVIIVAMKPLSEKTYVDQALKNGKGITWLDDCRIGTEARTTKGAGGTETTMQKGAWGSGVGKDLEFEHKGRFPANLLVSDDVLNDGMERKSGKGNKTKAGSTLGNGNTHGHMVSTFSQQGIGGDSGSYSRFFSLDAWAKTLPFLIVPKASKSEKNRGLGGFEEKNVDYGERKGQNNSVTRPDGSIRKSNLAKNYHPTVKPLKLMSYLITLGSREGDLILDPFAGSGTTCLAAKELKRAYIGIEREEEYVKIAEARLQTVQPTLI